MKSLANVATSMPLQFTQKIIDIFIQIIYPGKIDENDRIDFADYSEQQAGCSFSFLNISRTQNGGDLKGHKAKWGTV